MPVDAGAATSTDEPLMLAQGEAGVIPGTAIHVRLVRWLYGHGVSDAGVYGTQVTEATLELRDGDAAPILVEWRAGAVHEALGRRFVLDGDREVVFVRVLPD